MSDFLERLIASSLDLGDGRDDSTVVRPRRAALFEPTSPGDQGLLASPFEIALPVEEAVEETVSSAVSPSDDRVSPGSAWERGEERSGQDGRAPRSVTRSPSSQPFDQIDDAAATLVPRAVPGPGALPASAAMAPAAQETMAPAAQETMAPAAQEKIGADRSMNDYLDRLIDSSLDFGDGRDASMVVRPRRAALFERTAPGDQDLLASPFEIALPVEEIVEESVSSAVPPSDDRAALGPAWAHGRRYAERSGQDGRAPRRVPLPPTSHPFDQLDDAAPRVVPRTAPTPRLPPASDAMAPAAQETMAPAPAAGIQEGAPPTPPAYGAAERRGQEPVRRIAAPAERLAGAVVPRGGSAGRDFSAAASQGGTEVSAARSQPVASAPESPPHPTTSASFGEKTGSTMSRIFGDAGQSASSAEAARPVERARAGRAGWPVEPSVNAGRAGEPAVVSRRPAGASFQIEPSSVSVEARPRQEPATTIVVSIGRIEVRAPSAPPSKPARPRQPAARRGPALSLDAYLDQRSGMGR